MANPRTVEKLEISETDDYMVVLGTRELLVQGGFMSADQRFPGDPSPHSTSPSPKFLPDGRQFRIAREGKLLYRMLIWWTPEERERRLKERQILDREFSDPLKEAVADYISQSSIVRVNGTTYRNRHTVPEEAFRKESIQALCMGQADPAATVKLLWALSSRLQGAVDLVRVASGNITSKAGKLGGEHYTGKSCTTSHSGRLRRARDNLKHASNCLKDIIGALDILTPPWGDWSDDDDDDNDRRGHRGPVAPVEPSPAEPAR